MTERRAIERFDLQLLARISIRGEREADDPIELLTADVSAAGAFFQTSSPLPVGTEVDIDLFLPPDKIKKLEGKMSSVKISGSTIRSDERGMAIRFNGDYKILPLQNYIEP